MEKEVMDRIYYYITKKKSVDEICKSMEINEYELIGIIMYMKENGYLIDYINGEIVKLKRPISNNGVYEIPSDLKDIKMLFISDTHLTNKADRLDILRYLYEKAEDKDIKYIIHGGDLLDGIYTNRPQHLYELRCISFDEHLDYVIEKYPKYSGKTYFIGGNHMDTYFRNSGSDMGKAISKEREDMIYLGTDTADLSIGKLNIHMHHGGGGNAYSRSYKLQRYVETLPLDKKIDIVLQGHFHNAMYMNYMDKHCFQVGSLEDETPFSRSLGLKNEKSCWWVDASIDDKGNIYYIKPELETFGKKLVRCNRSKN